MTEDVYISLLYKRFSNQLEPQEAERLETWIQQSPENQEIAAAVKSAWEMGGKYTREVPVDLEADYQLLQNRIKAEAVEEKTIPAQSATVKTLSPLWKAAAAVALLLVAGFLLRNQFNSTANWEIVETQTARTQSIQLADGTTVWLNEGSQFSYPTEFDGTERKVKLTGEAFFDVAKDAAHPFIIETSSGEVRVLGTSFNVSDRPDDETMVVQVATGKVQVAIAQTKEKVVLQKNEKSTFDKPSGSLTKSLDASQNESAWRTKKLRFDDISLSEAIKTIEAYYKVHIEIEDQKMITCPLSLSFNDLQVQAVLETISEVYGMNINKQNNFNFELKGGQCNKKSN